MRNIGVIYASILKFKYIFEEVKSYSMKVIVKLIGVSVCIVIGIYIWKQFQQKEISSLLYQNIKALAAVEQGDRMICYNEGSIDCNEVKAEFVVVGIRK